ncbi:RHD3/Sey1 [Thamnocephalis sphaerospora]|uniref:RHD3/Sey1 n=1 Tax=Thamnocephalis sphaerospora TaxID=78915 RepID=A0A4P9XGN8_9FUNG|nr:RHD3/Sey1 [Thamnocephalis sphaerospora]|eukprot:RKP04401.1 RHD3/Sey1 [Thamnocephalis sphaerospora]
MARIWEGIAKPEHLENSSFSDFFDCMVVGLPPKPLMPEQFNEAVDKLRLRFTDPNDSNYVFKPRYHRGVPIDGFSHYASGIWDAVLADDMLSIPSQQMLLAEYRCAELRSEAEAAFEHNTSAIKAQVNDGKVINELGKLMEKARNEAIAMFDANAKHYHQDVYTEVRNKLYETFNDKLSVLFRIQFKALAAKFTEQFDTEMRPLRANSADLFAAKARKIRQTALQKFEEAASSMLIDGISLTFDGERESLSRDLTKKMSHYSDINSQRLDGEKKLRKQQEEHKRKEELRQKEMQDMKNKSRELEEKHKKEMEHRQNEMHGLRSEIDQQRTAQRQQNERYEENIRRMDRENKEKEEKHEKEAQRHQETMRKLEKDRETQNAAMEDLRKSINDRDAEPLGRRI